MKGFTLIELMIVVAIIAVVAALALPNLLSARLGSNETSAIGTLRAIVSSQSQFQGRALADTDKDGLGEFGTIAEMSGAAGIRGGTTLNPAVLSSSFRAINAMGEAVRDGYQYKLFLPNAAGQGLPESPGGGAPAGIDANLAEAIWCAYAWPTNYGQTGYRTFFVSQDGEIIYAVSPSYSGPGATPVAGAAMLDPGSDASITGALATGSTGRDGLFWRAVQK